MKEIIWIAGASSVGKKTFIERLLQERPLRESFELWGSIDAIDCKAGDFTTTRKRIANSTADHILLKWQYKDRKGIEILKEQYLKRKHKVIGAWCPYEEHFRRFRQAHSERLKALYEKSGSQLTLHDFLIVEFEADRRTNNEWLKNIRRNRTMSQLEIEFVDTSGPSYPKLQSI